MRIYDLRFAIYVLLGVSVSIVIRKSKMEMTSC